MKILCRSAAIGVALFAAAGSAAAGDQDCYDAMVEARVVAQVPSEIPGCADCVVFSWPWFVDLDISRVRSGHIGTGEMSVLTVQHTWIKQNREWTWRLRRNTLGGFNADMGDGGELCPAGTPPARAYLQPADGKTLDDVRRDAQARDAALHAEN